MREVLDAGKTRKEEGWEESEIRIWGDSSVEVA